MNTAVALPKNTLAKPHTAKANPVDYARWFVHKQMAEQLPREAAHRLMLDLSITLKYTRSIFQDFADLYSTVVIDPEKAPDYLTPGTWQGMKPNRRNIQKGLIISEAESFNADMRRMLAFLDKQLSRIDETDTAFVALCEARLNEYPAA